MHNQKSKGHSTECRGRRAGAHTGILRMLAVVALAAMLALSSLITVFAATETTAVGRARNNVVRVVVTDQDGNYLAHGTGFAVGVEGEESDIFVTNGHVVTLEGTMNPTDLSYYILTDDNTVLDIMFKNVKNSDGEYELVQDGYNITWGSRVECEVLDYIYPYPDVAIIRARKSIGTVALPLRTVDAGEAVSKTVYTIGYPSTADTASTDLEEFNDHLISHTVLSGAVEDISVGAGAVSRIITMSSAGDTVVIDHDAHMNEGNSGGPLVMEDGSVIAINTYISSDNLEYSYSIDISYAMESLDYLGQKYTDITGETINPDRYVRSGYLMIAGMELPIYIPIAVIALIVIIVIVVIVMAVKKKSKGSDTSGVPGDGPGTGAGPVSVPGGSPSVDGDLANLRIQGISGVFAGRRFPLEYNLTIGRDQSRCKLVYPNNTKGISGLHCAVRYENGVLTVTDLGSTYGTAVNGRKISPNTPVRILVGDKVSLGSEKESFQITRKGGVV